MPVPEPTEYTWEQGGWLTPEEIEQSLIERGMSPEDLVPPEAIEAERAREAAADYLYLAEVNEYVELRDLGPEWPGDPQPVIVTTPTGEEFLKAKGGRLIPVPLEWSGASEVRFAPSSPEPSR